MAGDSQDLAAAVVEKGKGRGKGEGALGLLLCHLMLCRAGKVMSGTCLRAGGSGRRALGLREGMERGAGKGTRSWMSIREEEKGMVLVSSKNGTD